MGFFLFAFFFGGLGFFGFFWRSLCVRIEIFVSRRAFLAGTASVLAAPAIVIGATARPRITDGVASGDVTVDSAVDYFVASVGMLPGTLLYVYYGKVAGDVAALAGGASPDKGAADYAVLALGLVATILVTALVTRTARRALQEVTGE